MTCDHGTECRSRVLEDWAYTRGVQRDFTRPGRPTDISYIESVSGKLRDECRNFTQFADIGHAQQVIAASRTEDSGVRPHGAFGHLTPAEFSIQRPDHQAPDAA
ncbi:MAG: integrase core domain-containing protein [Gemmatimonadaceae bacterium]